MRRKTFKHLLIGVIVVIALGVVGVFIAYRKIMENPVAAIVNMVPEGEEIVLGKVQHTATRDGRTEWELEAASAEIKEAEKQMILKDLKVVFYLKDNRKVHLRADTGVQQTETNNIEVSGQVVVKDEQYQLNTEQLYYDHKTHRLSSTLPVEITGRKGTLMANSMEYDIDSDKTLFEGNVKGIFRDQKAL